MYVIPKSLHPLLRRIHKIIRKSRLGGFWQGIWRKYGHAVLDQAQIEWIIKTKKEARARSRWYALVRSDRSSNPGVQNRDREISDGQLVLESYRDAISLRVET